MPMFYTPKPRQFHYQPRFYDPEKERWEALKQKYADERMLRELQQADLPDPSDKSDVSDLSDSSDSDLAYFQRRVRQLDNEQRRKQRGLTWRDLFRKREMPRFNYKPRFATDAQADDSQGQGTGEHIMDFKQRTTKIKRRFDVTDPDYLKPIPATRIMLYTMLVCLLLYWILF